MSRAWVSLACACSLAMGLFFILVWAPHPWGWEGFDDYHKLGLLLAGGESFPTTDVPWGYAYYLALFYRVFGNRPLFPLIAQAALNALMPLLVYLFAREEFDQRVATVAALLTGVLSFNTVYASTQTSDAVCNVLFMAALMLFARGRRQSALPFYAAAGVLTGLAAQFRPNLILAPILFSTVLVAERRDLVRVGGAVVLIVASVLTLAPWIVRNQRLTGELIPTSTHGGMQLWYGSLQTGPYLKSRVYNPQSVFEDASFPYTSLDRVPLIVTLDVDRDCDWTRQALARVNLVYWTDRDPAPRRIPAALSRPRQVRADMPPSPAPTTYYFYFESIEPIGKSSPHVFFVSRDHLGDMDRHDDLLDIFDLVRLLRFNAWHEPVRAANRLDLDGDGRLTETDVRLAVEALSARAVPPYEPPESTRSGVRSESVQIDARAERVDLDLSDGSSVSVPRIWSGRITDIGVTGALAQVLLHSSVPFSWLRSGLDQAPASEIPGGRCVSTDAVAVNAPFYREQPHMMRRYLALAMDNIRRDPPVYFASVAYRALRVFLVEGSEDPHTAQQFRGGARIYRIANLVSMVIVVAFVAGVWAGKRRHAAIGLPLVVIAFIPATLGFFLTNMRYSITVQPLLFIFIAAAIVTGLERTGAWPAQPHEIPSP